MYNFFSSVPYCNFYAWLERPSLQFPTSMPLSLWGVATELCPQLPPQTGISYVTDYIDLIVDDFFCCTVGWQGSLACQLGEHCSMLRVPLSGFLSNTAYSLLLVFYYYYKYTYNKLYIYKILLIIIYKTFYYYYDS